MIHNEDYLKRNWPLFQQEQVYLPRGNPTFDNPPFDAAGMRVLVVRLSRFLDVDRSTPHLLLHQAVRRALPSAYVDVAFFPAHYDRQRLQEAGVPLLYGVQSLRPVQDFDVVLISNAYTLELVNLPYLLLHSGIPLLASDRGEGWPPLILGGSNAMAAQSIVTPGGDSLVDALFFGEGEEQVSALVRALHAHADRPRRERLQRAAREVTGLWVTGSWPKQPVRKAVLGAPAAHHALLDYPLLNSAEAGTARLQINFGCPAFCTFCFEGYDRKPYREVPLHDILEVARALKRAQGPETLELYSFNFNTHRDILALLPELNRIFHRVSFQSQRVDGLHNTPGLLEAEVAADKRNFTLGVEGISARLRAWLHKTLTTGEVVEVLDRLLRQKIREIKLFYLLTGHETPDDLSEFHEFVKTLKAMRRRHNPGMRVVFSFGQLVRMPFTPLRYDRLFLDPDDWRAIAGPVKSSCETNGFEFRLAVGWEEYCASQVLALGGYWLHEPVIELARAGHFHEEGLTAGYWEALQGWMVEHGRWTPAFLGEKGPQYAFPFDFVHSDVPASFLYRQYEQAQACVDGGYCLGSYDATGRCLGCGACQSEAQRQAITGHAIAPPEPGYLSRLRRQMRTKWRLDPLYVRLRLPSLVQGVEPEWVNAWAMQQLLAAHPGQEENLIAVREALFTEQENERRYGVLPGESVFALIAWDTAALARALAEPDAQAGADVAFVSLEEDFEPGEFERLTLSLRLPAAFFPQAGNRLRDYLRENYVPCNLRREGEGYCFDLPERALKKRVLFEGCFEERAGNFEMRLEVGPKFVLLDFLQSFEEPDHYRRAEIAVLSLEL
jgi:radical SAM superfamily enzyme YgiQ (UPF0313 family)